MEIPESLRALFTPELVLLLTGVTVTLALVSALLVPPMLTRLPQDYLLTERQTLRERLAGASWPGRALLLGRNLLGAILLLLGFLMLFMPGQGALTILVAIALMDFPGKRTLERKLVARPSVGRAVNWLRKRKNQPPLMLP